MSLLGRVPETAPRSRPRVLLGQDAELETPLVESGLIASADGLGWSPAT
jgi:hypothetical protein